VNIIGIIAIGIIAIGTIITTDISTGGIGPTGMACKFLFPFSPELRYWRAES
jgi:hypothetical protein